jgi:hypothetical protein
MMAAMPFARAPVSTLAFTPANRGDERPVTMQQAYDCWTQGCSLPVRPVVLSADTAIRPTPT